MPFDIYDPYSQYRKGPQQNVNNAVSGQTQSTQNAAVQSSGRSAGNPFADFLGHVAQYNAFRGGQGAQGAYEVGPNAYQPLNTGRDGAYNTNGPMAFNPAQAMMGDGRGGDTGGGGGDGRNLPPAGGPGEVPTGGNPYVPPVAPTGRRRAVGPPTADVPIINPNAGQQGGPPTRGGDGRGNPTDVPIINPNAGQQGGPLTPGNPNPADVPVINPNTGQQGEPPTRGGDGRAIPGTPALPPTTPSNVPPPTFQGSQPPFDLNSAYNTAFTDALKQIQGLLQPGFDWQANQLNRNMSAAGAATGGINSGGFNESLGRAQAQLAGEQGSRLSDYTVAASEAAKDRALKQFSIQIEDDTKRYGINTNAQLEMYLQSRKDELARYGIDVGAIMDAYKAQLGLQGQMYTADQGFNADVLRSVLNYQLGLAGVDVTREGNIMNFLQGMYGLNNDSIRNIIGSINGTPPGNVFVKP